jgi:hypothetical protein
MKNGSIQIALNEAIETLRSRRERIYSSAESSID